MAMRLRAYADPRSHSPPDRYFSCVPEIRGPKRVSKKVLADLISQACKPSAGSPLWHSNAIPRKKVPVIGKSDEVVVPISNGVTVPDTGSTDGGTGSNLCQDQNVKLWAWLEYRNPPGKNPVCWLDNGKVTAEVRERYVKQSKGRNKDMSYLNTPRIKPKPEKDWNAPVSVIDMCKDPGKYVMVSPADWRIVAKREAERSNFELHKTWFQVVGTEGTNLMGASYPKDIDDYQLAACFHRELKELPPWYELKSEWYDRWTAKAKALTNALLTIFGYDVHAAHYIDIAAFTREVGLELTCAYHDVDATDKTKSQIDLLTEHIVHSKREAYKASVRDHNNEWYLSRQYSYWKDAGVNSTLRNPLHYLPAKMYDKSYIHHTTLEGTCDDRFYSLWLQKHDVLNDKSVRKKVKGTKPKLLYEELYDTFVGPVQPEINTEHLNDRKVIPPLKKSVAWVDEEVTSTIDIACGGYDLRRVAAAITKKVINDEWLNDKPVSTVFSGPAHLIRKMLGSLSPSEQGDVLAYQFGEGTDKYEDKPRELWLPNAMYA